jgi:hypothetical protein
MKDFPEFMKSSGNLISASSQSHGVKGWVFDGADGKQMASLCKYTYFKAYAHQVRSQVRGVVFH